MAPELHLKFQQKPQRHERSGVQFRMAQTTGISYEQTVAQQLWDVFEAPFESEEPFQAMVDMTARGEPCM